MVWRTLSVQLNAIVLSVIELASFQYLLRASRTESKKSTQKMPVSRTDWHSNADMVCVIEGSRLSDAHASRGTSHLEYELCDTHLEARLLECHGLRSFSLSSINSLSGARLCLSQDRAALPGSAHEHRLYARPGLWPVPESSAAGIGHRIVPEALSHAAG